VTNLWAPGKKGKKMAMAQPVSGRSIRHLQHRGKKWKQPGRIPDRCGEKWETAHKKSPASAVLAGR